MILEIGKSTLFRRLFRSVVKGGVISQRQHSILFNHCVSADCTWGVKLRGGLQKTIVSNQLIDFKRFSSDKNQELDRVTFESICGETLDSLSDYFEELVENSPDLKNADVNYSDGVLTVHLGSNYGTYVINRQTPNFQIWLSSPTSGPKRYDFLEGTWVYKHDRTTLHSLLQKELAKIVNKPVQFVEKCLHAKNAV